MVHYGYFKPCVSISCKVTLTYHSFTSNVSFSVNGVLIAFLDKWFGSAAISKFHMTLLSHSRPVYHSIPLVNIQYIVQVDRCISKRIDVSP